MKKLLLFFILALTPLTSFAAFSYTRSPAGSGVYPSVEYTVTIDDPVNDMPGYGNEDWICIGTFFPDLDVNPAVGDRFNGPYTLAQLANGITVTRLPEPGSNGEVTAVYAGSMTLEECANSNINGFLELEGDSSTLLFTVLESTPEEGGTGTIGGFNTGITIATASTTAMLASMGWAGTKVLFALLAVAIVIILLMLGFKMGVRAMQGKVQYEDMYGISYNTKEERDHANNTIWASEGLGAEAFDGGFDSDGSEPIIMGKHKMGGGGKIKGYNRQKFYNL